MRQRWTRDKDFKASIRQREGYETEVTEMVLYSVAV